MNFWLAVSLTLGVAAVYMLVIEIFSVAFKLTGLSTRKIRFQVASLFTGTGYTTEESELITNNEKRRKIALACIYTGHIFSVAFMGLLINVLFSVSLLITEAPTMPSFTEWYFIILYITLGFFLLVVILKIPPINRRFQNFLEAIAISSSKKNRNKNIITVIDMNGKYAIAEVILNIVPEFAKDTPLYQMELTKDFSITVLSIRRGSRTVEVTKDTMFVKGDVLVIHGHISDIKDAFVNSINKDSEIITIEKGNIISLINNYGSNALVDVYVDTVPEQLVNVKMQDARLNDKYNIILGIIKRKDNYIYVDKDTVIKQGDTLTLFGPYNAIKALFKNNEY